MLAHIRALHPDWSQDETKQNLHDLMENVKDLGNMLGYMTRDDVPIIDIHARTGRVSTIRCRGAPLLPSFRDVLHLKQVNKYIASVAEAQQARSNRSTPYDSSKERREGTAEARDEEAFTRFVA